MEILIVAAIITFVLIYNNTIDKNKFFTDNEKLLEIFREEDYSFLVAARYGESVDADKLYSKRITNAIVTFFIVLVFSLSGSGTAGIMSSQFFLNLVLSPNLSLNLLKISSATTEVVPLPQSYTTFSFLLPNIRLEVIILI